ncbi:MAG: hypothetical protein LBC40_02170, partial [Dysgonamonadaceae bacterium]|nr:hypothetical protein [Dysgonamonadaceae bacterium]
AEVRIYGLLSPPVNGSALKNYDKPGHSAPIAWSIFAVSVAVFVFIGMRRKRKQVEPEEITNDETVYSQIVVKENAIYVLGDFGVFDRRGNDITYRFSHKLKALFALILFNSKEESNGISTEKLTEELWPEKEFTKAKNIRGVTINHLRNILSDIDGIELIHKNSRWFFSFEASFYCDYLRSIRLIEEISASVNESFEEMEELLALVNRGGLFPSLQAEWIDPYKRNYENMIELTLHAHITSLYEKEAYKRVTHVADAFFVIDPLNESVLSLYIKSLRKLGKMKHSQVIYNRFCDRYKLSMGEEFGKTYAQAGGAQA